MVSKKSNYVLNYLIPIFCLVSLLSYLYKDAFSMLTYTWSNMPMYSHGFIIPFASLYFLWLLRDRVFSTPIRPNIATGAFITIAACLLLIFGKISAVGIIQQISILVMICGLILVLLGFEFMKILAFPVGYLILMIPLWDGIISKIQRPFQLLSANMAVNVLKTFGIPVHLDSNLIELPKVTLEVAKACSGVQYLISITAITIPLMFIFLKNKWARILLIISGILIGITTNWLRVVLVSLWAYSGGKNLHGPGHIFQGMFVSVFGFFVLFAIALLLNKIPSRNIHLQKKDLALSVTGEIENINGKKVNLAWFTAIFILLGTASYLHLFSVVPISLSKNLLEIPQVISVWQTYKNQNHLESHFQIQGADKILTRLYHDSSGNNIKLHIGYFESQSQGKELVHYTLQEVYNNSKTIEIRDRSGDFLRINNAQIQEGNSKYLVFYWYNINGRHLTNNFLVKLYTAVDGFLFKRTNGAMVIVSIKINNESEQFNQGIEFILDAKPIIEKYLPPNNTEKDSKNYSRIL